MPIKKTFSEHLILEKMDAETFARFEAIRRELIANLLFFMDNLAQSFLYDAGMSVKVVRTKKLDLGFILLADYNPDSNHNGIISEFLARNPSYWQIEDGELKLNSRLILDNRQAEIEKILKFYLQEKKNYFY